MKLIEIRADEPIVVQLIAQRRKRGQTVFYQDMGEILSIIFVAGGPTWQVAYETEDDSKFSIDYMTDEQLEAMDLVKIKDPISGMTAWRLQ